jgi:hypothetical protein
MKKMNKLMLLLLFGIFISSCEPDEEKIDLYVPKGTFDSGVLVLNEGGFQVGNASVSFISFDLNTTQNNIFSGVNNGLALGDTAQNIGFNGDLAFIVVNASNKIEVVNRYTMQKVTTITTGLINPRYIAFANGKGYVTNWGVRSIATDDFVAVLDLINYTVTSSIPVAQNAEKIISDNGKIYIAHDNYANSNLITIIDVATNTVSGNPITVEYGPNSLSVSNGILWVTCSGKSFSASDTSGKIIKINLSNLTTTSIGYSDINKHIAHAQFFNGALYYTIDNGIYKLNLTDTQVPNIPIFSSGATTLYGFGIANSKVYVADAKDYSSSGEVLVYSLGTDGQPIGTLLKTKTVGVIPNGFYFNQ